MFADWQTPSHWPPLHDSVHVWRAALDVPAELRERYSAQLADDERLRAARFHSERERDRYIVGRGVLRTLLGRYLAVAGNLVQFSYGPYGKPFVVMPDAAVDLRFNMAHSGGLVLCAVGVGRELGVDIETFRPLDDAALIAAHHFSPHEQAELASLPADRWLIGFYNCWTRKEAYAKARGMGLALPLDQFDVTLAPDAPARLLADRSAPEEAKRWALYTLLPGPGYIGALAVEGADRRLIGWNWLD